MYDEVTRIAEIEEHRVSTGETLESLAQANALTWQQLAYFNWETDIPDEINARIQSYMGSTRRSADSQFYVFDDEDDPGIILIPRPWEVTGLPIDTPAPHTIRVRKLELRPRLVACCRIPGITFEYDKSFIRPSRVANLGSIHEKLAQHPDAKVLIYGHTDRCGPPNYNKNLSDRRAESAFAFVTHDPGIWKRLYGEEQWPDADIQKMLKAVGHDPGPIDGIIGPNSRTAMRAVMDPDPGPNVQNNEAFREALFKAYMDVGYPEKVDQKRFVNPRFVGCGEFNPLEAPNRFERARDGRGRRPGNEKNRRVVFYLFDRPPPNIPCEVGNIDPCNARVSTPPDPNVHFTCSFYRPIARECPCECHPPPPDTSATAWIIEVEHVNGELAIESVSLEAENGTYTHDILAEEATRRGEYFLFRFPVGDPGEYSIFITSKGGRYCARRGLMLPPSEDDQVTEESTPARRAPSDTGSGSMRVVDLH